MKFASNWKSVLRKAWSIRLMIVAGLLSGVEVILPYLPAFLDAPQGVFAALSLLVTAGAFIARLLAQKELSDDQ